MTKIFQRGSAHGLDSDPKDGWQALAACRHVDPELFWPMGEGETTRNADLLALHICRNHCPVREQCDEWAAKYRWPGAIVGGRRYVMASGTVRESTTAKPTAAGCPICAGLS